MHLMFSGVMVNLATVFAMKQRNSIPTAPQIQLTFNFIVVQVNKRVAGIRRATKFYPSWAVSMHPRSLVDFTDLAAMKHPPNPSLQQPTTCCVWCQQRQDSHNPIQNFLQSI
jgi:hypothetical protein